ncbi:uncharacterized protein [Clytia hemisphaerica]|eukprot:TCONS_00067725-protein
MKRIGVTLTFWREKKSKKLEWTSLMGTDKKKMLRKLPQYFSELLPEKDVLPTQQLWKVFEELYDTINKPKLTEVEIDTFQQKTYEWIGRLKKMNGCGYSWSYPVTPYIHILAKHVPDILRKYGTLRIFSGQGVEKKNDDLRKIFHSKINRKDACVNLLKVEKRMRCLEEEGFERKKRSYLKKAEA